MNPIFALLIKDLRLFLADRKAVMITFIVPIAIACFMGSLTSGGGSATPRNKIEVLVVNEDRSQVADKLVAKLGANSLTKTRTVTRAEADRLVMSGKSPVAVVLPKGFGESAPNAMFAGDAPTIELLYDPSKSLEMQAVQGALTQAGMETVSQEAFSLKSDYREQKRQVEQSEAIQPNQKQAFVELFDSLAKVNREREVSGATADAGGVQAPFTVATKALTKGGDKETVKWSGMAHMFAGMAVQGVLFFAIDAAMGLLRDRRLGIWRRLRASPVSLAQLLAGKALGSAAIGTLVLLGVLAFGFLVMGIRVTGSAVGLLLVVLATAVMVSGFGLLIASLGRTEAQSRGLSIFVVLLMSMLGGAWFPSFMMPTWMQQASLAIPVRWAVDGLDAMLWRGLGLEAAFPAVAGLLAFAVTFASMAFLRFRSMPEG